LRIGCANCGCTPGRTIAVGDCVTFATTVLSIQVIAGAFGQSCVAWNEANCQGGFQDLNPESISGVAGGGGCFPSKIGPFVSVECRDVINEK